MVALKKRNRAQFLDLEKKKAVVENHRELCGSSQLKLENLLYKEAYLLREIQTCKQISTPAVKCVEKEMDIIIGVEKYSNDLPSLHKASLSLLRSELAQRKQMQATVASEREKKAQLEETIHKKQKLLQEIPAKLSAVAANTRQLCDFFEQSSEVLDMDEGVELYRKLPSPLYVLFRSLTALCHPNCFGKFQSKSTVNIHQISDTGAASELAVDLTLHMTGLSTTRRTSNGGCAYLTLRFRYVPRNNAVYVSVASVKLSSAKDGDATDRTLPLPFPSPDILLSLFPKGLRCSEIIDEMDTPSPSELGTCYLWAQWICGLRPFPSMPTPETSSSDDITSFGTVFSLPSVLSFVSTAAKSNLLLSFLITSLFLLMSDFRSPPVDMAFRRNATALKGRSRCSGQCSSYDDAALVTGRLPQSMHG